MKKGKWIWKEVFMTQTAEDDRGMFGRGACRD